MKHARTPAHSFDASVAVVIPARYASTRLPGKPLIDLCGQPMIRRVYERAAAAAGVSQIIVATDDARIAAVVRDFGGDAVMTSPDHPTGTDRLAEVALTLKADIVVNVQGDEPLIAPEAIEAAVAPLLADSTLLMATACEPLADAADVLNPNVVKVVRNARGDALYFSRCPIPYRRAAPLASGGDVAAGVWWKHTGLYAYRREFLIRLAQSPPCPLERLESLEQLRALYLGVAIRVVETSHASPGVDTPEDVERVRRTLMRAESHADCAALEQPALFKAHSEKFA